ncbi:MAG: ADP-L-glycero-D-mannoheptose-6-epimerase, partial [Burkholderiaceae bacterium]|nr:ADP-L-glycero-D-mannoheptose-6-epimerase [Burkholderiaceae bacterium]
TLRLQTGAAALSLPELVASGEIAYIPFPDALVGKYQCHTQADLSHLRNAGCTHHFATVEEGTAAYVQALTATA